MSSPTLQDARPACFRCRRPAAVCVCEQLRPVDSRTRVVFLQHPREAKMPVSTCRLAHLSLPNSELHVTMGPEGNARLEALSRAPDTMVLFPGPGSTDVRDLPTPPRTLIVVDGTWTNARKVLQRSPLLSALPRVGFTPDRPGNYRIRKEPTPECVSTIEAVAHILEALERAPGRFTPMLASFERMVDLQLAYVATQEGGRRRHAGPRASAVQRLRDLGDRLVLVVAEANVWPGAGAPEAHSEVLQWAAARPTSGARFVARLHPVRPLAPWIPRYLGLSAAELAGEESLAEAEARWRVFARPDDVFAAWGRHAVDVLKGDGIDLGDAIDLKSTVSNVMQTSIGGLDQLATRCGAVFPEGEGRAARNLAALEAVVGALRAGKLPG